MSAALYIVLDTEQAGFDPFINGKALSQEEEALAELAAVNEVKRPMDFFSMGGSDLSDLADELGFDAEVPGDGDEVSWFSAEEGLAWTSAMSRLVNQHRQKFASPDGIIRDLSDLEVVLEKAKEAGIRWRLAVDF